MNMVEGTYLTTPNQNSLDGGLFAYNKSQQSSLPFLKYNIFTILRTLGMPEHVWTKSVKMVVPILKSASASPSKKKIKQSELTFKTVSLNCFSFSCLQIHHQSSESGFRFFISGAS